MENDLQGTVLTIAGQAHPTAARELLHALTYAYGSGLPADDLWPAIATAISPTGTQYTRNDAYALLLKLAGTLSSALRATKPSIGWPTSGWPTICARRSAAVGAGETYPDPRRWPSPPQWRACMSSCLTKAKPRNSMPTSGGMHGGISRMRDHPESSYSGVS